LLGDVANRFGPALFYIAQELVERVDQALAAARGGRAVGR
jgi:hypothetical protein